MSLKIDQETGIRYFENLPEGYAVASLEDFHVRGRKKVGMEFLLLGFHWPVYFKKTVSENLTAAKILPWIHAGHIFIKKQSS